MFTSGLGLKLAESERAWNLIVANPQTLVDSSVARGGSAEKKNGHQQCQD